MTSQGPDGNADRSREHEYLTLAFSPTSSPLRFRWRNNGLSADFLGDYVTTFFPAAPAFEGRQNELKHAVTYIANELLENAMKYHQPDAEIPIRIHLDLASDHIQVSVSNGIGAAAADRYRAFVERLQEEGNPADLLIQQQEESAKNSEAAGSCLGLLSIITDYDAQLNLRFDMHPLLSQSMTVTTSAVLPVKNVSGVSLLEKH